MYIYVLQVQNLPSLTDSSRFCALYFSNSFKNIQIYRNVFFFGPDRTLMISQHLSNDSAYRHSSSIGLVNGSGADSSSISRASAAMYGLAAAIEHINWFNTIAMMALFAQFPIKTELFGKMAEFTYENQLSTTYSTSRECRWWADLFDASFPVWTDSAFSCHFDSNNQSIGRFPVVYSIPYTRTMCSYC